MSILAFTARDQVVKMTIFISENLSVMTSSYTFHRHSVCLYLAVEPLVTTAPDNL